MMSTGTFYLLLFVSAFTLRYLFAKARRKSVPQNWILVVLNFFAVIMILFELLRHQGLI